MIDLEPCLHGLGGIIFTLDQLSAAAVAHIRLFGGHSHQMVAGPPGLADTSAAHTIHDDLVGDLDGNNSVKLDSSLFQGLRLGDGAGQDVYKRQVQGLLGVRKANV